MITIVGARSYVPQRLLPINDGCRAELTREPSASWRTSCNYLEEFIASCDFSPEELANALGHSDISALCEAAGFRAVAVEDELTIPDMCVNVSGSVIEAAGTSAPLRTIICCQSSLDAEYATNESSVLRLQCEYGLKELGFSVNDHDGANLFYALALIDALHADRADGSILLCCAERWRQPFPRTIGASTILGDGAGALILTTTRRPGWKVRVVRTGADPTDNHPWEALLDGDEIQFPVPAVISLLKEALSDCGLGPSDLAAVVPGQVNKPFVELIHRELGVSRGMDDDAEFGCHGFLCSADPIVRLCETLQRRQPAPGDHLLLWGAGLSQSYGCAILEYVSE